MTAATAADGSFTVRDPINATGPILQGSARTTDIDTGAFVDATLFG
jgi:hypothetical protein